MRRRTPGTIVVLALLVPTAGLVSASSASSAAPVPEAAAAHPSATLLDWQRTAMEVVYAPGAATGIPTGVPLLGFTSLAVHDAVTASRQRRDSSEQAAAATAAFRVLSEYVPSGEATLLAQRTETFEALGESHAVNVGRRIGRAAAEDMIARRVSDGRELEGAVVYDRPDEPGIWQPDPPATNMSFAHLGFVDLLVLAHKVELDGPDPLGSAEYAQDFREVKARGSDVTPTPGTPAEARAATANFFNFNAGIMVGSAVVDLLETHPLPLRRTALLFAAMHGAMTDSVITAWRLKYQVAFWRPRAAIRRADEDGNPATVADPAWEPRLANPAYSDYVSGHASVTSPAVEVVRQMLGEDTRLALENTTLGETRVYTRLTRLEREAFNSRIWGGFHFRDAMDDGYELGHRTARRVMQALG